MKKFLIGVLLLSFSFSTFADCTNAYEIKAQRRAVVNKNWKKAGIIAVGAGAAVGGIVGISVLGGLAWIASPLVITVPGALTTEFQGDVKSTRTNTYFKSLASIEAAKSEIIPIELIDKLDKKMNFYSLSHEQQVAAKRDIVDIIKEGNSSGKLCFNKNKVRVLNFRKFVKYVYSNMSLNY